MQRPSSPISSMQQHRASPRMSSRAVTPQRRAGTPLRSGTTSSSTLLPDESIAENIRVAVRVRPKTSKEAGVPLAVIVENDQEMIVSRQRFRFDQVFSDTTTQEQIFKSMAAPLVESVCQGTNCALFAYGQTGTGKTFTMLGFDLWQLATGNSNSVQLDSMLETNEMRGVIPRAMKYLFSLLQGKPHKVSVSYLEIYNEKILDLLGNATSVDNLELREDKTGAVQVIDATVKRVNSLAEVLEYLWKGAKNRAVSSTDMNEHSSRSHTIFQVTVEIKHSPDVTTKAKLNLIDLAGSEKWRPHLEFSDQRIAEMTSINQSLSNLGNCVRALLRPGKNHIPYRNSKLTRLVSDSLGGNAKTGFVVTVSPSELAHEETISTLQFADRAKKVVVRNETNYVETSEMVLKRLEQELQRQMKENKELREQLQSQQQQQLAPAPVVAVPAKDLEASQSSFLSSTGSQISMASSASALAAAAAPTPALVPQALSKALRNSDSNLLSKPQEFLQDYHDHLRNRTSDGLTAMERLALLEWSVTLQSEQLVQSIAARKEDTQRIALLQTELAAAREQIKTNDVEKRKLQGEVQEWKKKLAEEVARPAPMNVGLETEVQDLRRQLAETKREELSRKQRQDLEIAELKLKLVEMSDNKPQQRLTPKRGEDVGLKPSIGRQASTPSSSRENEYPFTAVTSTRARENYSRRMETPPPVNQQEPKLRTFNSTRASPRALNSAPQVWDRFVDEATGRAYYHCKDTGQTTWKRPADSVSQTIIVRGE